jgi:hypothetical protein
MDNTTVSIFANCDNQLETIPLCYNPDSLVTLASTELKGIMGEFKAGKKLNPLSFRSQL